MNFEERPWGNYTVLYTDESCQVKKLVVNPGKRISLQSHKFRAEHWFIVSGQGNAELNGQELEVEPGSSIDVPIGSVHRISCGQSSPKCLVNFAQVPLLKFRRVHILLKRTLLAFKMTSIDFSTVFCWKTFKTSSNN
jgi:mannose-6-phosphate isomerase-like protein (cupin superfamily)